MRQLIKQHIDDFKSEMDCSSQCEDDTLNAISEGYYCLANNNNPDMPLDGNHNYSISIRSPRGSSNSFHTFNMFGGSHHSLI